MVEDEHGYLGVACVFPGPVDNYRYCLEDGSSAYGIVGAQVTLGWSILGDATNDAGAVTVVPFPFTKISVTPFPLFSIKADPCVQANYFYAGYPGNHGGVVGKGAAGCGGTPGDFKVDGVLYGGMGNSPQYTQICGAEDGLYSLGNDRGTYQCCPAKPGTGDLLAFVTPACPGMSGGPLVDKNFGTVVGILTYTSNQCDHSYDSIPQDITPPYLGGVSYTYFTALSTSTESSLFRNQGGAYLGFLVN